MTVAILAVILEIVFALSANAMSGRMSEGFAWFVVVMYILCTLASFVCLIVNISGISSSRSKAKYVVGLIFSIIGLVLGLIFCITFFAGYSAL